MGIGASIVLIAGGLILAIATDFELAGLDIQVVGWILVAAGGLGLIMTTLIWGPGRNGRGTHIEERRIRDEPPPGL